MRLRRRRSHVWLLLRRSRMRLRLLLRRVWRPLLVGLIRRGRAILRRGIAVRATAIALTL
jgi:hypothetical protein